MRSTFYIPLIMGLLVQFSCKKSEPGEIKDYSVDQFADVEILRYEVPGFESLSLQQKTLIYYLNEAALQGRDILFDQNYRHNLLIRKVLETIYIHADVQRTTSDWKAFETYLKRV